jgi:hypothetical protein
MRLAALVFLLIIGITPLGAEDGVWIIREREVPPPTDVSPQLRESIRNAPQPDVAKAQSFAVSTPEEWREENRRLEPDNQARAKAALDLAESYGVSVVEGSIAGVTVHRLTPFLMRNMWIISSSMCTAAPMCAAPGWPASAKES